MKILAFGEIMLRLSAVGDTSICDSKVFNACYGGTEANVLACLSNFGRKTEYLTALPDTELGRAVLKHLHGYNVDTSKVKIGGDVLGMYFVENGNGSRGSNVVYLRRFSEVARLTENDFDYDAVFDGVTLFHISGISFALSESCRKLAFRLLDEAKKRNVTISFDFNYRSKLWTIAEAKACFLRVIDKVDIVLASSKDLSVFLDLDENGYFEKYNSKYLILRNREVESATLHTVNVTAYGEYGKANYRSPQVDFAVKEKIGGGDAFDGAILHCLLDGKSLEYSVKFAISAFIMKHSVDGDTFTKSAKQVEENMGKMDW